MCSCIPLCPRQVWCQNPAVLWVWFVHHKTNRSACIRGFNMSFKTLELLKQSKTICNVTESQKLKPISGTADILFQRVGLHNHLVNHISGNLFFSTCYRENYIIVIFTIWGFTKVKRYPSNPFHIHSDSRKDTHTPPFLMTSSYSKTCMEY